jgi:hypothetical protein
MALCLTARQGEILEYYQTHFKKNGTFPNTSDAARHFGKNPTAITAIVGALFLKGAFTDGKALTSNYKGSHRKAKPSRLNLQAPPHSRPRPPIAKPKAEPVTPRFDKMSAEQFFQFVQQMMNASQQSNTLQE